MSSVYLNSISSESLLNFSEVESLASSASSGSSGSMEYDAVIELRRILHDEFISNHPVHWLVRFGTVDGAGENLARIVYRYIQSQNGKMINLSEGGTEVEQATEPASGPVVSFLFFRQLCKRSKQIRKQNYNAYLEIHKLDRATTEPSVLLQFAVIANYWEKILSLVERGGVLSSSEFNEQLSRSINVVGGNLSKAAIEWVGAYKKAYKAMYGVFLEHSE